MKSKLVNVTPKMAMEWLQANSHNRKMKSTVVESYLLAIEEDRWMETGDPIQFDTQGRLLNGQHRLKALALSGKTLPMLVVTDLEPDAFQVIDIGSLRNKGDMFGVRLKEQGMENPTVAYSNALGSACNIAARLEAGSFLSNTPATRITAQQALAWFDDHPEIEETVKEVFEIRTQRLLPAGVASGLYYLFQQKDRDLARQFMEGLLKGIGVRPNSPLQALRDRLIKDLGPGQQSKLIITAKIALTIKAWNALRSGRNLTVLRFQRGGKHKEEFPTIL